MSWRFQKWAASTIGTSGEQPEVAKQGSTRLRGERHALRRLAIPLPLLHVAHGDSGHTLATLRGHQLAKLNIAWLSFGKGQGAGR
jgi:hypothetical protein